MTPWETLIRMVEGDIDVAFFPDGVQLTGSTPFFRVRQRTFDAAVTEALGWVEAWLAAKTCCAVLQRSERRL